MITALVIPVTMLITATGMLEAKLSANLMSLGALDFGLIVDGAVIIVENSLRHLAERQRELGRTLSLDERLETVTTSAKEMIQPTVYGQAIIILVYVPLLTFTGVEGKTFMPMAMTVIIALATAFVLSLTFVPAMVAIAVTGRVQEKENLLVRGLKALYQPALARAIRSPLPVIAGAVLLFAGAVAVVRAPWSGVHADARREEHRHGGQADSEHVAFAIAVHAAGQRELWLAGFHRSPSSSRAPALPTSPPIRCRRARPTPTSS